MADEIKVDIVSEYDDKDAKKALADAEKLDKLDPEVEVTADADKAIDGLTEVQEKAEAIEKLDPELEVKADVSKVLSAFDDVISETKDVQAAAERLALALGPELAAKADTTRIVTQLQEAGLSIDTIKNNADELAGKLREAADVDVGGKLGASLGTTRGQLDEVSKSASSSKNALANMVGNTAQDMGELGGVVGSLGVGLGQMAEFAADAAFEGEGLVTVFGNMVKVAGPIAALALLVEGLKTAVAGLAESNELNADNQERWNKALKDATDPAAAWLQIMRDSAEESGKVEVDMTKLTGHLEDISKMSDDITLGKFFKFWEGTRRETMDISEIFERMPGLLGRVSQAVTGTASQQQKFREAIRDSSLEVDDQTLVISYLNQQIDAYNTKRADMESLEAIFGPDVVNNTNAQADAMAALATQQDAYVGGLKAKHNAALAEITDGQQRINALEEEREATDRYNAAAEQHKNKIAAINVEADRLDRARILREEKRAADEVTNAYKEMHDELSDRRSLLTLQGDFDTLRQKAEDAWVAASEGADDAEQKQRDYQIAQIDTINNALEYISTIESIPDKAVTDIEALIDQGKYNEALNKLEILSQPRSINLQIHLDELAIQRQIRRAYANAGLPSAGPVSMPTATATTAPVNVNINMPRGSRGVDVLRQVSGQARRSGRRYGTPVVHYARLPVS